MEGVFCSMRLSIGKIKKSLICLLVFQLLFGGLGMLGMQRASANTVDASSAIYVATTGSDLSGDGSQDHPYRTLLKAKQSVREINANMTGDIRVYLREGIYYQTAATAFDEADSGTNGYRVIYESYPGEKAQIAGGQPVTGWTLDSGHIYKANVGTNRKFYTLFEDGNRATMARTPNSGYLLTQASVSKDTQITYKEGDLPEAGADYSNAQVYDWPGDEAWWNWSSETRKMTGIDFATNTISLEKGGLASGWQVQTGSRYFVQGSKALLDAPGEFYLDEATGTLYYWPMGDGAIEGKEIVAPTTSRVIELKGSSEATPVHDLSFENLTIRVSDFAQNSSPALNEPLEGMIYLENAEGIEIRNNRIGQSGFAGIMLNHYAQRNVIAGNWIEDLGTFGVGLFGWGVGEGGYENAADSYVNKFNTVTNNYIHDFGKLLGHGSGIQLSMSGDNQMTHNEISKGPRYGISIKGTNGAWVYGTSQYGTTVTETNFPTFNHARNNTIAYNDISDVMKDTTDGGAYESWCPGLGNILNNNRIHDIVNRLGDKIMGIYLDDNSSGYTVTNNIIYGIHSVEVWPMTIKGVDNTVSNNIIADSDGVVDIYVGDVSRNLSFTHNIVYRTTPRDYNVYFTYRWSADKLAQSDYNLTYHGGGRSYYKSDGPFLDTAGWKALYGNRYDQHSLDGVDPRFVDPAHHDYTLQAGSPALALGFVNIDQDAIGLSSDFPWTVPSPDYPEVPAQPVNPGAVVLQAESYSEGSNLYISDIHDDYSGNGVVGNFEGGDYMKFRRVELNGDYNLFTARYAVASPYQNQTIQVRLDSLDGPIVAELLTEDSGGWDKFIETSAALVPTSDTHDVYVIGVGGDGIGNMDSFTFSTGSLADNRMSNPGFEQGLTSWQEATTSVVSKSLLKDKRQGTSGYGLTLASGGSFSVGNSSAAGLAGGAYRTSVWAKSAGTWNSLRLQVYRGATLLKEAELKPAEGSPNERGQWNRYLLDGIQAADEDALTVKVLGRAGSAGAAVTLDDFELVRTGEAVGNPDGSEAGNLLLNPGLEGDGGNGDWAPWTIEDQSPYNVGWADGTDGKHTGNFGHTHWSGAAFQVKYSQTVPQVAAGVYRASVWSRTGDANWDGSLKLKVYEGDALLGESAPIAGGDYARYEITGIDLSARADIKVVLEGDSTTGGWLSVDDFEFIRVGDSEPAVPVPHNVLVNGDFETGTAGWTEANSASVYAFNSTSAGEFRSGVAARGYWMNGGADGIVSLSQTAHAVPGGNYKAEVWTRHETFANAFEYARLKVYAGDVVLGSVDLTTGGAFSAAGLDHLAIPDGADITVTVEAKLPGGNGYVTVDDALLISEDGVPTPRSLIKEAESYTASSGTVIEGDSVVSLNDGDWFGFRGLYLYGGFDSLTFQYGNSTDGGSVVELRADDPVAGPYLGGFVAANTGGSNVKGVKTVPLAPISGQHDLYVVIKKGDGNLKLDSVMFNRDSIDRNLLTNPGFESGEAGWSFEGSAAGWNDDAADAVHLGNSARNHWLSEAGTVKLTQTVDHLPAGTYQASVWSRAGANWDSLKLSAFVGDRLMGETNAVQSESYTRTGIESFVVPEDGSVTVVFEAGTSTGNTYLTLDDFELIRQSTNAGLQSLEAGDLLFDPVSGAGPFLVNVSDDTDSMNIIPHLADKRASVAINGTAISDGAAFPINLLSGLNTITVNVTPEAHAFSQSYTLLINRKTVTEFPLPEETGTQGASAGNSQPPSLVKPWQQLLSEALLREAAGTAGDSVSVALQEGKTELLMPAKVVKLLNGKSLIVDAQGVLLTVPASLLTALTGLLEDTLRPDAVISLTIRDQAPEDEVGGAPGDSALKAAGTIRVLELSIAAPDGTVRKLDRFPSTITLRMPYAETNVDEDLLGIYFYDEPARKWSYVGGQVNKTKHIVTANLEHFSKYAVFEYNPSFTDVPSRHYASRAIEVLAARHIVTGRGFNAFSPSALTTRAEFSAMIARALNLRPADDQNSPFRDVAAGSWYADDVQAAFESGIVTGTSASRFEPNAPISRQEMALMLYRAYRFASSDEAVNAAEPFADQAAIASWALKAVNVIRQLGIMTGTGNGKFSPTDPANRAQTALALYNLLELTGK